MSLKPTSFAAKNPIAFARLNPANAITPLRLRAFLARGVASACRRLLQLAEIAEQDAQMTEDHLADVVEAETFHQAEIRAERVISVAARGELPAAVTKIAK